MKQETRQRRGRPWLQELTYGGACSRSAECKPAWRCSRFIATLTLMLLLLLTAGGSQAWAANWLWDKSYTDDGGGNYKALLRREGNWPVDPSDAMFYFKTLNTFDMDKDQFYWEFDAQVYSMNWEMAIGVGTVALDGEIYLVTSDNVSHKIGTWKKALNESTQTTYSVTDSKWGTFSTGKMHGDKYNWVSRLQFYYVPNRQAVIDGVKRIAIEFRSVSSMETLTTTRFEKDITISGISTDKPMPKPTVEWGTDGKLAFKATGVPDKRNNNKYDSQGYTLNLHYYDNGQRSYSNKTFSVASNNLTYSNETNGKMDVSFNCWPLTSQTEYAKAAYTMPVYVDYYGYILLRGQGNIVPWGYYISQPLVEGVLIKPFTRPVTVSVEFDKWNKKNTVKWTRQTSTKGYNGSKVLDVECRYEGKWHVLRYERGYLSQYKEIGTLDGSATKLEVTDTDFEYDRNYTYRVVFLPTILETAYGTKLHQLPGYQNTHNNYDLWEEREVSTALGLHITLSQDMSNTSKVRLRWQYSIPQTGLTWYIDYKPTNGQTWQERTETIPVDANQTEATADFSGSVCEAVTYRVKTKIGGQYVYSDTLSARLSTGSFIRNVKATTGTEQTAVKVEWDVENADPTNKIAYLVRRRPVGTDEWTTVSDSIKDTKEHYEWTDTRPQTGTYYEYTVEAYGTVCTEQVEQSRMDGIVVPGFSQARGTITGHIAYGSGTAVQGARVNLVKSSADQESDQVQYLSRYIEGAGKGLVWQAEGEKYANLLCGSQPATLQLWAKPASDGSSHYLRPKRQQNDTILAGEDDKNETSSPAFYRFNDKVVEM